MIIVRVINLIKTAAAQIVRDDHVCYRVEHELYIVCVGGAGHVAVYLLRSRLVLRLELRLDVRSRFTVLLGTCNISSPLISKFNRAKII